MAEIIEKIIEKINAIEDSDDLVMVVNKHLSYDNRGEDLMPTDDLKALATELTSLRAEVEGYRLLMDSAYVIKIMDGIQLEQHVNDQWTYVGKEGESTPYFKTAIGAFTALQQQEDKQDGRG